MTMPVRQLAESIHVVDIQREFLIKVRFLVNNHILTCRIAMGIQVLMHIEQQLWRVEKEAGMRGDDHRKVADTLGIFTIRLITIDLLIEVVINDSGRTMENIDF